MSAHTDHVRSGTDKSVENVLALFRHVGALDAKIALEHSFKAIHGHLFGDRLLLGLHRAGTQGKLDRDIASICEQIGMPHNLLVPFMRTLRDANHVYFGIEKNEKTVIFKAYLEFRDKIEREIGDTSVTGKSYPLFTGFKWDTLLPSQQVVTSYDWYPRLRVPEILARLRVTLDPARDHGLFDVTRGIIERASEKTPHGDIQYVEVTEEGNPRRSYDVNLYKAGYRVEDMHPFLLKAAQHYAIPFPRFNALYEKIRAERFGHVAGGVDRIDRDFMTVYYGVKIIDSSQLRSAAVVLPAPYGASARAD